ncbi:MAG: 3-dehydroquinate synthase [Myxococcaceae bacterium]|nr:3-dehydroquinate synthase [Myxococcaceae bacterium]
MSVPGRWLAPRDVWCTVSSLGTRVPAGALWVVDARVAALHPSVTRAAAAARAHAVVTVRAGERLKSLAQLEALALHGQGLSRQGAVVAVGGGTVGDTATVLAHLLKRGVTLVQVPSTLLAAVDSSLGGKGAVNLAGVKNALGVFHSAAESFLCAELFATLSAAQRREGAAEAYKMAVCLDGALWKRWRAAPPDETQLIREARRLKTRVCARDPYETLGLRAVLNFGHTFGHVVESLTRYRVRHGEAVGLGMHAALDVGRALRVTPDKVASEVEAVLRPIAPRARARLAAALAGASEGEVAELLAADKKATAKGLSMVLLEKPGSTQTRAVDPAVWKETLRAWKAGRRP